MKIVGWQRKLQIGSEHGPSQHQVSATDSDQSSLNASGQRIRRTAFVSVESGVTALGFRRVAAIARQIDPTTDIYFVAVDNLYSLVSHLLPTRKTGFDAIDAENAGRVFAQYDLVCFSSMTASAPHVEAIIQTIRRFSSGTFILFGGVHAILNPDATLSIADAICINEGEKPFSDFFRAFLSGADYMLTPGMWFNTPDGVRANPPVLLNSNEELSRFPHLYNGLDCQIYDLRDRHFRQFDKFDYVAFNGLTYRTLWSIGCPYKCTFCANDAFIALDKRYTKLRYPIVDYMIGEIEQALALHPYISTVAFYDDNFIALPLEVIRAFSTAYRERIGLPFVVFGVHPNIITEEKIDLLASAGLNRARMGIQSGNEKSLRFYNRRTTPPRIRQSVAILGKAARRYKMIPPAYDVISDNPVEEREDIIETLRFLYDMERPYVLTVFSLRVFPGTNLWEYFNTHPQWGDPREINSSYLDTRMTMENIALYLLGTVKPPVWVFEWMLRRVKGYREQQPEYRKLYFLVRTLYLTKRAFDHLSKLDFTVIVGKWTYYVWKLGLVGKKSLRS